MDVDPDELLVTTGGQQVIDLVCKTLIDPGDVIVAEAPTYPGAVPDVLRLPGRRRADRDGRRRHARSTCSRRRSTASTREGRTPKFIYTVPTFQNPAGVTMSLERRRRLVRDRRASASCSCSRTTRTACCATRASRCRRSTRSTAASTSSTSARSRRSSRPACGSAGPPRRAPVLREDQPRQAGRRPVLVARWPSTSSPRTSRSGDWRGLPRLAARALPPPARRRCSTRWPSTSRPRPTWTRPEGGLFIWATLPDYIDTTDLLARALREHVAFVPGRAAYLDGRGGSSMRLNFSGVGEDDIREGVRRIGKVVARAGRALLAR